MKLVLENWRKYLLKEAYILDDDFFESSIEALFEKLKAFGDSTWIFFDTETTGFKPASAQLTEIGAISAHPDNWQFAEIEAERGIFYDKIKLTPETLAGYKAVIESFAFFEKAIPMMMTAAGTIPAAKVLVIGAGGLGCPLILYLTYSGVGNLGIVDHDKIELSNLSRQVLFTRKDIGKYKTFVSKKVAKKINKKIIKIKRKMLIQIVMIMKTRNKIQKKIHLSQTQI